MTAITDFAMLRRSVEALGITVGDHLLRLAQGVEITSQTEFVAAPNGFYDVLPTGHIVRVLVHLAHGGHTRCHDDPEGWHRYHAAPCTASARPSRRNRSFKTRRTDGRFTYYLHDLHGREYRPEARERGRPLKLCGHCRNKLGHLGLALAGDDPDLPRLLGGDLPRRLHHERFTHDHDRITGFPEADWKAIAAYAKSRCAGCCSRCGLRLGERSPHLHAHYVESLEPDGCLGRVVPLCIGCHSMRNGHRRIRMTPEFARFRREHPDHPALRSG